MSQIKFQRLIQDFSPASLADVFKEHDFFLTQENQFPIHNSKQFTNFEQIGTFNLEDKSVSFDSLKSVDIFPIIDSCNSLLLIIKLS